MSAPFLAAGSLTRPEIVHGFFGREGGVSEGPFASLNCALTTGDDMSLIEENRRRVAETLGVDAEKLVSTYQIHSPNVIEIDRPWPVGDRPRADGLVTRRPGVALGVLSADCAPVLFADAEAGIVGAAHAGWRGARTGVTDEVVAAMVRLGARPEAIDAAIGPCIGPDSYEVGPEFPGPFIEEDPANARFFRPSRRAGHHMFDLPGYLVARLERQGLRSVVNLRQDTCADRARFFSYRRTCLDGEKKFGCEISAIALRE
jgi:YfiH family protein